jgi:hypothetical protein
MPAAVIADRKDKRQQHGSVLLRGIERERKKTIFLKAFFMDGNTSKVVSRQIIWQRIAPKNTERVWPPPASALMEMGYLI